MAGLKFGIEPRFSLAMRKNDPVLPFFHLFIFSQNYPSSVSISDADIGTPDL
jgi:hypothetical protein